MISHLKSPLLLAAHEVLLASSGAEVKQLVTEKGEVLQAFWPTGRKDGVAACFARSEGGWYFASDEDGGMVNIQLSANGHIQIGSPDGENTFVSGRIQGVADFTALLKALRELQESDVASVEIDRQPLASLLA